MSDFKKRVDAIKILYPSVTCNQDNKAFDNSGNEVSIDEELIATKITELETLETTAETNKENAKLSGNQKLLDLGLTQEEATALTGYTPPTEV